MEENTISDMSVSLFGPLLLRTQTAYIPINLTGATRELLTLLLAQPNEAHRRELLVANLWPDANLSKGRSALTTALWRINKLLSRVDGLRIRCFDDNVLLNPQDGFAIDGPDLVRLSDTARRDLRDAGRIQHGVRRALADLLRACHGSYLEGCDSTWALSLRAKMEVRRMRALDLLMQDAEANGALEDAVDWGQAMLALDPLRESVYHKLIWLYAECGERNQAILTYEMLRQVLHQELQVEPDPMTRALRDKILEQRTCRRASRPIFQAPAGVEPQARSGRSKQ